jgi:iron complex transport system substrate-binding protein
MKPQRIVSLVPSTTESVCAFGAAERLVGCTRYCEHPASALANVVRVGGTKNPKRDAIAQLEPDLVLCNAEENREEDIEWLRARAPVLVQSPCTVAQAAAALEELGGALGCEETAAQFVAALGREIAAPPPARRIKAFYAIWKKPWMSVGATTYIHDVLRLAGFDNVCAGASSRYPETLPEEVAALRPEVVLLPDEPWVFDEQQLRELAASGPFGSARLLLCSGRDFCWHGVHAATGLRRARALALAALQKVAAGGA